MKLRKRSPSKLVTLGLKLWALTQIMGYALGGLFLGYLFLTILMELIKR